MNYIFHWPDDYWDMFSQAEHQTQHQHLQNGCRGLEENLRDISGLLFEPGETKYLKSSGGENS